MLNSISRTSFFFHFCLTLLSRFLGIGSGWFFLLRVLRKTQKTTDVSEETEILIALRYPSIMRGFSFALNISTQMRDENTKPESCMTWRKQLKVKELASSYAPTNRIKQTPAVSSHPHRKCYWHFTFLWKEPRITSWRDKAEFKAIITVRNDGKAPWRDALCPQTQFSTLIKSHGLARWTEGLSLEM